jgi:hypothetical protein
MCNRHLEAIEVHGRLGRQEVTGYGERTMLETTTGRYKALI